MKPRGRCVHEVNPKGTLSHTSQKSEDGSRLILTRMPASFHCSTMVCTVAISQGGSFFDAISMSMPSPACRLQPAAAWPSQYPVSSWATERSPDESGTHGDAHLARLNYCVRVPDIEPDQVPLAAPCASSDCCIPVGRPEHGQHPFLQSLPHALRPQACPDRYRAVRSFPRTCP